MKKQILVSILITFFIVSCSSTPQKVREPSWVSNPSVSDKIAGIGICGTHIHGKTAQRNLAVKRAIDEIAAQIGVTVNNVSLVSTKGNSSGASTSIESYSLQSVEGKVVSAIIKGSWKDPQTDELYIWMVTK